MANEPVETYAAVDLGSNSFHMIVASYSDERIQVIDRIKKMVRLASGLDENNKLSEESMQSAIDCLQEFGQRLREIPRLNVRAVGTNTLRQASNGKQFTYNARKALGHPIQIIAGLEEARLVYLGVAHTVYNDTDKRLVIDIGGGSTELIIGKGFDIYRRESLYMGCVNMTRRFFDSGNITKKGMQKAILATRQELQSVTVLYNAVGWIKAIGASGTIMAINSIVTNKGWSSNGITRDSIISLKDEVIKAGNLERIQLEGLSENRVPVFAGGLAVLCGIFEAFDIDQLEVSEGALREGLLYDLIGRYHDKDVRDSTILELARRFNLDTEQATRVRTTAIMLFEQVVLSWELDKKVDLKFIEWGAYIHEIGLFIAHAQYHRHGAYLIANSDLAGFSREEQERLALIVRGHRRKYPLEDLAMVSEDEQDKLIRLCILLRLAIVMNRSRHDVSPPTISLATEKKTISLIFPPGWLESNPLTRTDLENEASYMKSVGYSMKFDSGQSGDF
jgi:exopolyphosphatase / guanosine-5'-triphosphate,3'-diphosphate pyrophosphatase